MKATESAYKAITELMDGKSNIVRKSDGFMDLIIETLGEVELNGHHAIRVSIAHYYTQNGDRICDPDVVFFVVPDHKMAYAAEIQHSTGHYTCAMKIDNGRLLTNPRAQRDIQSFCRQWFSNLRAQGFFKAQAEVSNAE